MHPTKTYIFWTTPTSEIAAFDAIAASLITELKVWLFQGINEALPGTDI
jgi:hypothetical protein